MVRRRPSLSSIVIFLSASIFLLLVQFGYVSPVGIIIVTEIQYTVLFWLSVVYFILSIAILFRHFPRYAKWSTGYSGDSVRTVRISGKTKDYFIHGAPDATVRDVLLDVWPFDTKRLNSSWQVFNSEGNEVSDHPLESLTETIEVVFSNDDPV